MSTNYSSTEKLYTRLELVNLAYPNLKLRAFKHRHNYLSTRVDNS